MRMDWSRRGFLTVTGAAAASPVVAPQANAQRARTPVSVDIAILGAGLSGLTAARSLLLAGVDSIAVIEARDRVGGRTFNHDLGGGRIAEGGGQWIGPTQTAVHDLCKELGVGVFPTYLDGDLVYLQGKDRFPAPYADSKPAPGSLRNRIDLLASDLPPEAPWTAPRASEWDAMTVADWADANQLSAEDRAELARAASLTLGTTPDKLSFLYFLYYVRSAGSLHDLESMRGGAQDSRIVGGSQILSTLIAQQLGDRLHLKSPARRIRQTRNRVVIETASGQVFRAEQLIVAMMPADCDKIAFQPALPLARAKLQALWPRNGDALKINVVYSEPFWRKAGLNGMVVSDSSVVPFATDNSPPDGSLGVILILTGKAGLPPDRAARQTAITEQLERALGPEAARPLQYHEMDWGAEAYTSHCVSGLEPGVLSAYGSAMRAPVGRIHWAGTEASTIWTGYMDGAVRAGIAAANAARARL